jgi:hypothetical protein
MTRAQEFRARMESGPSGRVYVRVPFDASQVWGKKAKHYVTGTINGKKVRGSVSSNGEFYFLSLGPVWRRDAGIGPSDELVVVLAPEGPQQETLSEDVTEALSTEPRALELFNSLATFYRKGYVNWVEGAKRPETRASRIKEMVDLLKQGKKER